MQLLISSILVLTFIKLNDQFREHIGIFKKWKRIFTIRCLIKVPPPHRLSISKKLSHARTLIGPRLLILATVSFSNIYYRYFNYFIGVPEVYSRRRGMNQPRYWDNQYKLIHTFRNCFSNSEIPPPPTHTYTLIKFSRLFQSSPTV